MYIEAKEPDLDQKAYLNYSCITWFDDVLEY